MRDTGFLQAPATHQPPFAQPCWILDAPPLRDVGCRVAIKNLAWASGRYVKTKKTDKFLTEIYLSGKIIRKTKIFPVFFEIFPIFAILTLLPVQRKGDFTCFPGKFPVICGITLPPGLKQTINSCYIYYALLESCWIFDTVQQCNFSTPNQN